jgi:glutamate-1-semialdehyde aminotransferase
MSKIKTGLSKYQRKRIAEAIKLDNHIQFVRLLAELDNSGVFANDETLEQLCERTDMSHDQILDVINDAIEEFDKIKESL